MKTFEFKVLNQWRDDKAKGQRAWAATTLNPKLHKQFTTLELDAFEEGIRQGFDHAVSIMKTHDAIKVQY